MRVVVMGSGGLGGYYGALLAGVRWVHAAPPSLTG